VPHHRKGFDSSSYGTSMRWHDISPRGAFHRHVWRRLPGKLCRAALTILSGTGGLLQVFLYDLRPAAECRDFATT
jgi:hypothetical protein